MIRTDGDAKLCLDESVVDHISHVFERLPVVFTDTHTEKPWFSRTEHSNLKTPTNPSLLKEPFLTSCRD